MKDNQPNPPQLITIREFCARYSVGRTKVYELLNARELEAKKMGSSTLIVSESAEAWLERLPAYGP